MQEHGRVIAVCAPRTGVSARTNQPWYSQDYAILVDGRYERQVAFSIWGQQPNQLANLQPGEYVTIHFEIESHESDGRWYTELRCYDVEKQGRSMIRGAAYAQNAAQQQPTAPAVQAPNANPQIGYAQQYAPQPYPQQQSGALPPIGFPPTN